MGLLYGLTIRLINFAVFFLIIILIPNLPPRTTFPFKEFEIAPSKELKGALELNQHLDGAERLLEGRVYGPECLLSRENEIYMGIHGGEIVKVNATHETHIIKLGQPCEDIIEESRCGRPLGLAFDTLGNNLIIADAYYGIFQVDLNTLNKKLLVSPQQQLAGEIIRPAKLFNSIAVDKKGDIYWTDSSSDFLLQDLVYALFANPSGRLFKYDRKKNESKVLLDELYFANGVALSPDEDFIIVAETGAMRLTKFYLKGTKSGQSEVFVDGLPGLPDNLTPDSDGIWVPLVMASDSQNPNVASVFSRFPNIRLFLARMLALFEMPWRLINNAYPNRVCQRLMHFVGHGESVIYLAPARSTIVRLDWNGNIVGSLHGFDKSVGAISHVLEHNNYLLFGSPFNRFIGQAKSPKPSKPGQRNVRISNVRYEGVAEMEPNTVPDYKTDTTKATTTTTAQTSTTNQKPTNPPQKATKIDSTTSSTTTAAPTVKPTTTTATIKNAKQPTRTTTVKPPQQQQNSQRTTTKTTTTKPISTSKSSTPPPSRTPPKQPAPVKEDPPKDDVVPPQQEKLKVIDKHGNHVEL